jgi:predicted dehydrogenase
VEAGYEFGTDDWREVVYNDDVHIINCSTPNKYHKELLLEAIKAGKHIYCDKPLALNLSDAEEILAASRKGKGEISPDFEDGLEVQKVMDCINKSAESNTWVKI